PALDPSDDLSFLDQVGDARHQFVFSEFFVRNRLALKEFRRVILRAKERTALSIAIARYLSRLIMVMMPTQKRGAERATSISRRWLNPDLLEWPFSQDATVAYAIQRDAAR